MLVRGNVRLAFFSSMTTLGESNHSSFERDIGTLPARPQFDHADCVRPPGSACSRCAGALVDSLTVMMTLPRL